jgi:hypothetical protein
MRIPGQEGTEIRLPGVGGHGAALESDSNPAFCSGQQRHNDDGYGGDHDSDDAKNSRNAGYMVCPSWRDRLKDTEEYVTAMKAAAAKIRLAKEGR